MNMPWHAYRQQYSYVIVETTMSNDLNYSKLCLWEYIYIQSLADSPPLQSFKRIKDSFSLSRQVANMLRIPTALTCLTAGRHGVTHYPADTLQHNYHYPLWDTGRTTLYALSSYTVPKLTNNMIISTPALQSSAQPYLYIYLQWRARARRKLVAVLSFIYLKWSSVWWANW